MSDQAPEQIDIFGEAAPIAAPAAPAVQPVSTRLFEAPQTMAGQLAMTTDTPTGD